MVKAVTFGQYHTKSAALVRYSAGRLFPTRFVEASSLYKEGYECSQVLRISPCPHQDPSAGTPTEITSLRLVFLSFLGFLLLLQRCLEPQAGTVGVVL